MVERRRTETHEAVVDAWLAGVARESALDGLDVMDAAFRALWGRVQPTLGEITLVAIVGRVLHASSERFPVLQAATVDGAGIHLDALKAERGKLDRDELSRMARTALVELLTVVDHLTGGVLTPALHAELSSIDLSALVEQPRRLART
jgi:hypothetical protein